MVGVPGRSKACVTCLKRKKRCDLQKPFCGTCRKACVDCGGYYRPRIFINSTAQNLCLGTDPVRDSSSSSIEDASVAVNDEIGSQAQTGRGNDTIMLHTSLARSAYQNRYLELFWKMYLPNGRNPSPEIMQNVMGGWINTIQTLHSSDDVLGKVILAFSMTTIGKYSRDRALQEEGVRAYADSLKGVALALRSSKRSMEDGLLTAIRLFSLYESMYGGDGNNIPLSQARSWVAHNLGDAALIFARTPYAFITGHAHRLFVDGRFHLALSNLRTRKRSFLADDEWKTIPWAQHTKSPRDYLVDIIIDISTLFEGIDVMKATKNANRKETARQQLLFFCYQLHQGLLRWHSKYAPDFEPKDEYLSTTTPQTIAAAYLAALYWATSIAVCSNFKSLLRLGETWSGSGKLGDKEDPRTVDLDFYCQNILRTIPYFFRDDIGLFRVHLVTYPLTVAFHYVHFMGLERTALASKLMACLDNPACAGIRRFIESSESEFDEYFE